MKSIAIAQVVLGVAQIILSFTYVDGALAIATGATVLQAINSSGDVPTRARALMRSCTQGVAIAEIIFAVLSFVIYVSLFFTVGLLMYAFAAAINRIQVRGAEGQGGQIPPPTCLPQQHAAADTTDTRRSATSVVCDVFPWLQNNPGVPLTPDEQTAFNRYCGTSALSVCNAIKGTLSWVATWCVWS